MSVTPRKFLLSLFAVLAFACCTPTDLVGQGFRIGNFMQAGGGQGFRMGIGRFGMHFGGGQGASIGGQNFGMRFGNGTPRRRFNREPIITATFAATAVAIMAATASQTMSLLRL